jgi:hypothetical protein
MDHARHPNLLNRGGRVLVRRGGGGTSSGAWIAERQVPISAAGTAFNPLAPMKLLVDSDDDVVRLDQHVRRLPDFKTERLG